MRFRCFALDPPWEEHGGGGRGCQRHYSTMPVATMPRAIMAAPAWRPATSAHCWVWATRPFLKDGLWLLGRLGFLFKTEFIWLKEDEDGRLQRSLGQYGRTVHESLLFGTRGSAMMPETVPDSVLRAPVPTYPGTRRRRHSAKPPTAYTDLIEVVSPGPRVEFFARDPRPGWHVTGLDSDGARFTDQRSLEL